MDTNGINDDVKGVDDYSNVIPLNKYKPHVQMIL